MHKFRRISAAIVAMACILAVGGCSKKSEDTKKSKDKDKKEDVSKDKDKDEEKADKTEDEGGGDAQEETYAEFGVSGEYIVFSVIPDFELQQDAWMGIVPAGKDYKKEVDADEVDVLYVYPSNMDKKASEKYRFEFYDEDVEGLDDGKYSMVLCNTDEDSGKVLLQFPIEIKGKEIIPDFSKITVN
ncbi:MAG: hypothetical protein J5379_04280 [Clostridiales bacterium]|nr:hypothetical protein [Clostridiales bacterium]